MLRLLCEMSKRGRVWERFAFPITLVSFSTKVVREARRFRYMPANPSYGTILSLKLRVHVVYVGTRYGSGRGLGGSLRRLRSPAPFVLRRLLARTRQFTSREAHIRMSRRGIERTRMTSVHSYIGNTFAPSAPCGRPSVVPSLWSSRQCGATLALSSSPTHQPHDNHHHAVNTLVAHTLATVLPATNQHCSTPTPTARVSRVANGSRRQLTRVPGASSGDEGSRGRPQGTSGQD